MRTELLNTGSKQSWGYATPERYEFACPCGKGKIVEEHDKVDDVYIQCVVCFEKFILDISKGIRQWNLLEK